MYLILPSPTEHMHIEWDGGQNYLYQSDRSIHLSIYVIFTLLTSPQVSDRLCDFDNDHSLSTYNVPDTGLIFYKCNIILSFQEPNELGSFIDRVALLNHWKIESFAQVNSEQNNLNQDLVASKVHATVLHHLWVITDNLTLGKKMVGMELNPEEKLGFSFLV